MHPWLSESFLAFFPIVTHWQRNSFPIYLASRKAQVTTLKSTLILMIGHKITAANKKTAGQNIMTAFQHVIQLSHNFLVLNVTMQSNPKG